MFNFDSRNQMLVALSNPSSLNYITKEAFDFADKDNNGYIDYQEFELCVKNVADFFKFNSIENAKNHFERLDTDKNGVIDFEEFKQYVKEIIDQILS